VFDESALDEKMIAALRCRKWILLTKDATNLRDHLREGKRLSQYARNFNDRRPQGRIFGVRKENDRSLIGER
jgi:hypothetical protein